MKKITVIMIALLMLIVTGCSKKEVIKHNYTYKGENEYWEATFTTNGTETFEQTDSKLDIDTESKYKLTVTYKNDLSDLASVKKFGISFETLSLGGSLTEEFNENESIKSKTFILSGGGSSIPIENDIIKVTINIDGDVQTLELKNENKRS